MKLSCNVVVSDLNLPSLNMKKKAKPLKSSLSIGFYSNKKESEPFFHIATALDKNGTKYKVFKNIEKVFSRFVEEGRATIRFVEPKKDVMISDANNVQLKTFLQCLSTIIKTGSAPDLTVLRTVQLNEVKPTKTKLNIRERHEYPVTTSFPSFLEELIVQPPCHLKRIDSRIGQLKNLRILNLSGHQIQTINPVLFGLSLTELNLSGNIIEQFQHENSSTTMLVKFLNKLDLSKNRLTKFPSAICFMNNLACLNLSNNQIVSVPSGFSAVPRLNEVKLMHNQIQYLPYSVANRRLRYKCFDISSNNLLTDLSSFSGGHTEDAPSLISICSDFICNHLHGKVSVLQNQIPAHLFFQLENAGQCMCSRYTTSGQYVIRNMPLQKFSETVISVDFAGTTVVPVKVHVCSSRCLSSLKMAS